MNGNNIELEKGNINEFCQNRELEEIGCSRCPIVGIINSFLEKEIWKGGKVLYALYIKNEENRKESLHYFYTRNFQSYENEEQLKKMLRLGAKIKAHGDFVKVDDTRIRNFKSISEIWYKES